MKEFNTWKTLSKIIECHATSNMVCDFSLGITEKEFENFEKLIFQASIKNGWFTEGNIRFALKQISSWLDSKDFASSFRQYYTEQKDTKIAVIMAGNLPLVGIHDFITVLSSGCSILCKMSKDDDILLKGICDYIELVDPVMASRIEFSDRKLNGFDALIATGSDTSNESFKTYFGKSYHLFRGHRTSIAVINGEERVDELERLGDDIFLYFGRGCRNVTHLCLPTGYDIQKVFSTLLKHSEVVQNKKYGNNYDYNKAIFLMNQEKILDNNFVLFRESKDLFAPIAVVNYHYYNSQNDLEAYIDNNKEKIQCIVGKEYVPFGGAQCPSFLQFADDVNTFEWIKGIPC